MLPPTYEGTCAGCHDLRFDPNIQEGAPHDKPEAVYAFLQKTYSGAPKYSAVRKPARLIPSSAHNEATTPTEHLAVAARLLWAKTCNECHNVEFAANNPVPAIADAQITRVWLPHSRFDHAPHRSFTCTSCHQTAPSSQQTADVLVPGIAVCQTCHSGDAQQAGRSENRCFECHEYHDWKNQPAFRGNYTPAMRRTRTE
jgi:predicted CXXCH cytochrome family protein